MRNEMRDDFSEGVKEILRVQVGGICSNPTCRKNTFAADLTGRKKVLIGEAAHIKAASPGGPRFDASQSAEERRSVENGIWLCCNCAQLIDSDPDTYSVETLHQWKEQAILQQREVIGKSSSEEYHFERHEDTYLTESTSPGTLFCSVCYDSNRKVIQMKKGNGLYECPVCKNRGIYDQKTALPILDAMRQKKGRRILSRGIEL